MPSSPPGPPPADANTSNKGTTTTVSSAGPIAIIGMIFGAIWIFVWHLGAASLSYAKYGSLGWAIVDFFFAMFYYPFYALVLNTPTPTMMGGRRRLKLF
jgi:hypothetical protein